MRNILDDAPPAVRDLMNSMWADIVRLDNEREAQRAKAAPEKHRNSRVMDNARYRFFRTKNLRGSEVRFCYSTHRNVAGFFLVWREVVTKKQVKRDQWDSTKLKEDAVHVCRQRLEAARKARHIALAGAANRGIGAVLA